MNKSFLITLFTGVLIGHACLAIAEPISNRITVTVRGQGPDVVLIPGLACSSAVWSNAATHLEKQYRLHLVQVAGFAGAPARANAAGPILQPTADAIDAYIKTNHLKAPKLIGHSLGGLMGLMIAAQHPDDVSKLMVVDSLPFFGVIMGSSTVAEITPQAAAMRDGIIAQTPDAFAEGETSFMQSLVKSEEGRKAAVAWAVASDRTVLGHAMYEALTTDMRPRLHDIKTPTTVLYAWDKASGVPQATADSLYSDNYASLTNKTLVRIEDSFHFIMQDQPKVFAEKVDAFLK